MMKPSCISCNKVNEATYIVTRFVCCSAVLAEPEMCHAVQSPDLGVQYFEHSNTHTHTHTHTHTRTHTHLTGTELFERCDPKGK
jgi:hypothetical protein